MLESTLKVFCLFWELGVGPDTVAPTAPPSEVGAAFLTSQSPRKADQAREVMESSQVGGTNGQHFRGAEGGPCNPALLLKLWGGRAKGLSRIAPEERPSRQLPALGPGRGSFTGCLISCLSFVQRKAGENSWYLCTTQNPDAPSSQLNYLHQ